MALENVKIRLRPGVFMGFEMPIKPVRLLPMLCRTAVRGSLLAIFVLFAAAACSTAHAQSQGQQLRTQLDRGLVYPVGMESVHSSGAALRAGAEVLFLSGAMSSANMGVPDTGNYQLEHVEERLPAIRKAYPDALLVIDVDGAWTSHASEDDPGYEKSIQEAVEKISRLKDDFGVAAIVLDDQEALRRKAEMTPGKEVIPFEYFEKLIVAIKEVAGDEMLVVGRTAAEDTSEAKRRGKMLAQHTDLVIMEALNHDPEALKSFRQENPETRLATIQIDKEGGGTPWTRSLHEEIGLDMVFLPRAVRDSKKEGVSDQSISSANDFNDETAGRYLEQISEGSLKRNPLVRLIDSCD